MKAGRGARPKEAWGQRQGSSVRGMATNDTPRLGLITPFQAPAPAVVGGISCHHYALSFRSQCPSNCFVHVTIVFTVPQLGGELAHYGLIHFPYLASALLNNLSSC